MNISKVDWNKIFEFAWRILVFIVAVGIIIVVSTNWSRWEGGAGWQRTNDAYLQADLTPISAKVAGYVRELVEAGVLVGDPVALGYVFWAAIHGLIVLDLAGRIPADPGFEALRRRTLGALMRGLRL